MGPTEPICPHCGHDFPAEVPPLRGTASSAVADAVLLVGQAVTGLGCILALLGSVFAVCSGQLFGGLVIGPAAFVVLLALCIVFARVLDQNAAWPAGSARRFGPVRPFHAGPGSEGVTRRPGG